MQNAAGIVMRKEIRDSLRDRRTLFNTLVLGPLFGPVLFVMLMHFVVRHETAKAEGPLSVSIVGAERAPNLVNALRQGGVKPLPAIEEPERAVREQRADVVLRIPERYASQWQDAEPAEVEIIYDSSRRDAGDAAQRLERLIEIYGSRVGSARLMMRGLSPALVRPVSVAERDQATPAGRGALLFAMLPYFMLFAVMFGGMFLAIDATAGERERQSLEPLLVNPVPRGQVLLGKILAAGCFSLASAALSLAALAIAGRFLPIGVAGAELHLGAGFLLRMVPVLVPMAALFVVLQTLVAAHARSFREAQTWLGLLQAIPIIPSLIVSLWPINPPAWMYAVPLASQQFTVMRLLRAEPVSALQLALGAASTLLLAVIAFLIARRSYASEKLAVSA